MSRFIRLSKAIINTHLIEYISLRELNKINIYMLPIGHSGMFGFLWTEDNKITIEKDKQPVDYSIVETWIKNNGLDKINTNDPQNLK